MRLMGEMQNELKNCLKLRDWSFSDLLAVQVSLEAQTRDLNARAKMKSVIEMYRQVAEVKRKSDSAWEASTHIGSSVGSSSGSSARSWSGHRIWGGSSMRGSPSKQSPSSVRSAESRVAGVQLILTGSGDEQLHSRGAKQEPLLSVAEVVAPDEPVASAASEQIQMKGEGQSFLPPARQGNQSPKLSPLTQSTSRKRSVSCDCDVQADSRQSFDQPEYGFFDIADEDDMEMELLVLPMPKAVPYCASPPIRPPPSPKKDEQLESQSQSQSQSLPSPQPQPLPRSSLAKVPAYRPSLGQKLVFSRVPPPPASLTGAPSFREKTRTRSSSSEDLGTW